MPGPFEDRYGFPRHAVTLANWRQSPYSRWSFQNLRELVPSAEVACGHDERFEAPASTQAVLDTAVDLGKAGISTVRAFLDRSHTDSFVVMHRGEVIAEHAAPHADAHAPHVVFSISKSLTALLWGVLEGAGILSADARVTDIVPEAAGSAYGDCTCREVLDMRVSLAFEEDYLDPNGAFARYRRAMLWNPPLAGAPSETLAEFLLTLPKGPGPHGGPFAYASPNSDFLGLMIERASGRRFADLMSELIWRPLGAGRHATVTVDGAGHPRTAGGICVTAGDLARLGEMLRCGGTVNGRRIVPEAWLADMLARGDHAAYQAGSTGTMPKGRYRSQWYQTGEDSGAFCAIGIHGQWLYVDPRHETVIAKLSSQPDPLDDELKPDSLAFFRALGQALSALR